MFKGSAEHVEALPVWRSDGPLVGQRHFFAKTQQYVSFLNSVSGWALAAGSCRNTGG